MDQDSSLAADTFTWKLLDILNHGALALMISVGHRTGLFDSMVRTGKANSRRLAECTALSERYVREWLGAMVTGEVVAYDPEADTYHLPEWHAACLTRAAGAANLAAPMQWIAVLGGVEDEVVHAFHHGSGVPYEAYRRFHEVTAQSSEQATAEALENDVLPRIPDLMGRLQAGIDVLDIGCGFGRTLLRLASRYPRSRFVGLDLAAEPVLAARIEADRGGLRNVRFERADAAEMDGASLYDLVTAFDAIHDQARPARVLNIVARLLRPGGVFLMQEIAASSHVEQNRELPLGPFIYTVSCMHCMSVSLANGGPGLGAAWGRELALAMLAEAGFNEVQIEQSPRDLVNLYYVATPAVAGPRSHDVARPVRPGDSPRTDSGAPSPTAGASSVFRRRMNPPN